MNVFYHFVVFVMLPARVASRLLARVAARRARAVRSAPSAAGCCPPSCGPTTTCQRGEYCTHYIKKQTFIQSPSELLKYTNFQLNRTSGKVLIYLPRCDPHTVTRRVTRKPVSMYATCRAARAAATARRTGSGRRRRAARRPGCGCCATCAPTVRARSPICSCCSRYALQLIGYSTYLKKQRLNRGRTTRPRPVLSGQYSAR